MRAENGVFGTCKDPNNAALWAPEKQIPVFFSNPDLVWSNDFPQVRYGQGALQESMAAVYKCTTGYELQRLGLVTFFSRCMLSGSMLTRTTGGKPSAATYTYTSQLLSAIADPDGGKFDGKVYM